MVYLSPTVAGKTHDKKAADEADLCIRSTAPLIRTRLSVAMSRLGS